MAKTKPRADGRYQRNVYIGKVDGKPKYKTVYGDTDREAEKNARQVRQQLDKGIDVISANTSFEKCVKKWLKSLESQLTPSTYNLHAYRIGVFTDSLGSLPIVKIKPDDLQGVLNDIAIKNPTTNKKSASKTVLSYKNTVQLFYRYLNSNRYIEFDSSAVLTIPKTAAAKSDRRALTSEEQRRVKEFKHRAQLPAMLAMLCGLRRGEISALEWSDIDFDNKTITIQKSYDFKNNAVKEPKTKAGIRIVPMPDDLIKFLKPLKKKKGLVVTNTEGNRMTEPAWQRLWTYYMNAMNRTYGDLKNWKPTQKKKKPPMVIEPFTMHCLRHTYATILYDAGVDVLSAKDLLGHSDISTTMGIYTHLSAENKKINIEKLNNYLNNSQDNSQKS